MSPFIAGIVAQIRSLGEPRIELPRVGLTLLPPWGYAICRKGKRCENRAPSVAGRLRDWRGIVALTHSANWNKGDYNVLVQNLLDDGLFEPSDVDACAAWSDQMVGKVFAAAELIDVRPNGDGPSNDWAVPGEHGLWLGGVIEVEPMACTGGRGVFRFGACIHCGRPSAHERDKPIDCRKCSKQTPFSEIKRPLVGVRQVWDGKGKLLAVAA